MSARVAIPIRSAPRLSGVLVLWAILAAVLAQGWLAGAHAGHRHGPPVAHGSAASNGSADPAHSPRTPPADDESRCPICLALSVGQGAALPDPCGAVVAPADGAGRAMSGPLLAGPVVAAELTPRVSRGPPGT